MEREEFLSKLGIGLLAVCTGCGIASCSSNKSDNPTPGGGGSNPPPGGAGPIFTADLNTELTSVGASKINSGVILVRIAASNVAASFTAVQVACTHEGTNIAYNATDSKFVCPLHGSQFSQTGTVLTGPAVVALKKYTISISGNTLTVA